ncbi:glycoside hydrolase family 5 protein [Calocera viscosa TUFC12733]|uniref:cellulase n=1 Tax=Calocera viscosa (strain TUFC12733) TaxID=1330018 RepID=A0A167K6L6_CALVF|nr:glycoside hydrolase family 5 protein [Calocera viscosa TUFC12733]
MKYFFSAAALLSLCSSAYAQVAAYGQCGGSGSTTCVSGYTCTYSNAYYSTSSAYSSSSTKGTATSTASGYTSTTTPAAGSGKVKFAGINISGFDFGCDTSGDCTAAGAYPPLTQYYGPDGFGQMTHFVKDDTFNMFRLPVGWQYLTNNVLGGTLNQTNFAVYNTLVQDCLGLGAHCIIDIHNYARWNGEIIGQGGPPDSDLAALWSSLATYYKSTSNVIFGIMNEPHDLPNVTIWANTVQASVTAIRNAGATTQYILLPGNDWTSAATIWSDGSGAALLNVKNPDGTKTNLIFDVHKYSDSDNSGTSATCVTDNISTAFAPLADWLRSNGRQAINSEFGGGDDAGCVTYISTQLAYLNTNSDVYLGWTGWAAGSFDTSYVLSLVPTNTSGVWTDTELVAQALVPAFKG